MSNRAKLSTVKRKTAIKCPACKREGDWFAGAYGPFCSRRCKLVDLGKWFGEEHVISGALQAVAFEDRSEALIRDTSPDKTPESPEAA